MRLKAFHAKNYKTIEDSGRVEIEPNVTCLMGKNESGKSAAMQALWKFNNVAGARFDRLFDLPAEHFTRLRTTDPEAVVLEFALDQADKSAFLAEFKALTAAPETVTVRATYDGKRGFEFLLDYAPEKFATIAATLDSVSTALKTIAASGDEGAKIGAAVGAIDKLREQGEEEKTSDRFPGVVVQNATNALTAIPKDLLGELGQTGIEALKKFGAHTETADLTTKASKWFESHLPVFIYFEDYGRLRTRIHLPDFILRQQQFNAGNLKDPEEQMLYRTQAALFAWANLDPNELLNLGKPKQTSETIEQVNRRKDERARILESASYQLSGDWVDWWDQRSHTLHISADGDELELRVSDDVNPWRIAFGERSRGFQWFFSFYLTFLVESGKAHRGAIVLLDEPGLHLHPKAQLKLLSFFQKIATKNQLLYSSHSMFMVDPDHVENLRTVYLKPKDPSNTKSRTFTKISESSEPEGDAETLLPMQGAGAYLLAQTLFLGKRTLIVEGISDYWILKVLSNHLQEKEQGGLHEDTVILWAGGTSHMLPLASVMSAGEQVGPNRMAVLLDSDKAGLDKAKKLVQMLAHGRDSVLLLGEILGIAHAEAEDIPEFAELLAGLKKLGMEPSTPPARASGETNAEILKRMFSGNGWGDLSPDTKARIVLRTTDLWREGDPGAATLQRARKIFQAVNESFEKLHAKAATPVA